MKHLFVLGLDYKKKWILAIKALFSNSLGQKKNRKVLNALHMLTYKLYCI